MKSHSFILNFNPKEWGRFLLFLGVLATIVFSVDRLVLKIFVRKYDGMYGSGYLATKDPNDIFILGASGTKAAISAPVLTY